MLTHCLKIILISAIGGIIPSRPNMKLSISIGFILVTCVLLQSAALGKKENRNKNVLEGRNQEATERYTKDKNNRDEVKNNKIKNTHKGDVKNKNEKYKKDKNHGSDVQMPGNKYETVNKQVHKKFEKSIKKQSEKKNFVAKTEGTNLKKREIRNDDAGNIGELPHKAVIDDNIKNKKIIKNEQRIVELSDSDSLKDDGENSDYSCNSIPDACKTIKKKPTC